MIPHSSPCLPHVSVAAAGASLKVISRGSRVGHASAASVTWVPSRGAQSRGFNDTPPRMSRSLSSGTLCFVRGDDAADAILVGQNTNDWHVYLSPPRLRPPPPEPFARLEGRVRMERYRQTDIIVDEERQDFAVEKRKSTARHFRRLQIYRALSVYLYSYWYMC